MSKRLALLIGHTAYQDGRLLPAHEGSGDVTTLAETLRDPRHGRFDHVTTLLDKTAVDAQLAIAAFLDQLLTADDLILLYFAGHCLLTTDDVYLAAADTFTEKYLDVTTIQADFVKRRLNYCPAQAIVVVDCLYSPLGDGPEPDPTRLFRRAFGGPTWAMLVAAAATDQPSAFTQALTGGLRHFAADADGDGRLTVQEWAAYAQAQTAVPCQTWATAAQEGWVVTAVSPAKLAPILPASPPIEAAPALTEPSPLAATPDSRRNVGIAALVVLMFLMLAGWYVIGGGFDLADGSDAVASPTGDTAVLAAQPSASATVPLTDVVTATAVTPAATPSATQTTLAATESPTANASSPAATTPPTSTAPPAATVSPTATPSPTITPSPTTTPTATAIPTPLPMEIVAQAAFLRAGPGTNYRIIAFPPRGTQVTAVGRNTDATWYNVILPDGGRGWLYTDVVRPADAAAAPTLPIAATIPAPVDEFYDFLAQNTGSTLIAQVYHAYVGTRGDDATLRARVLPETDQIQVRYLSGVELGLGLLIVEFSRPVAGDAYTSTGVEFCMVDAAGEAFHCQTFPARKEW